MIQFCLLSWFTLFSFISDDPKEILQPFLDKLGQPEEQIRIAWFGDSGIEADLITQTIRDSLQKWHGGKGVGYMPVLSRAPGYRKTITHKFSSNWLWESLEPAAAYKRNPGISGHGFYSYRYSTSKQEAPWALFRANNTSPRIDSFPQVRLFYGKNRYGSLNAKVNFSTDSISGEVGLRDTFLVNDLLLYENPTKQIRISAQIPPEIPLYGLSMESKEGVLLDNFSLRGLDGPRLTKIPVNMLAGFQEKLKYDLIVFQFGLNVLGPTQTDYRYFEIKILKLIQHFQQAFPGVPILIIGPPDKCNGPAGGKYSNPGLPYLTASMQKAAKQGNAAFFSLAEAMGGPGSMKRWVEKERPALAAADYTHFTFAGAEKAAHLILPLFQK